MTLTVTVQLTPQQLDSMRLALLDKVEGIADRTQTLVEQNLLDHIVNTNVWSQGTNDYTTKYMVTKKEYEDGRVIDVEMEPGEIPHELSLMTEQVLNMHKSNGDIGYVEDLLKEYK